MIIGFILLTLFYFVYMVYLVVSDMNSLIIIASLAMAYVIYFGIISKKPENSLYAFLLLFLFFPKSGNDFRIFRIEELVGISFSLMLQDVAAFTICLHLIRAKKLKSQIPKKLGIFCLLISCTVIFTFILALVQQLAGGYWELMVTPEDLTWAAPLLYGLIFLYGCIAFIKRVEQIEQIFMIILFSGIDLVLEAVLYFYLRLPLPFSERAIHESGRFMGFFFADFVTLALVCFMSIGCALYFLLARKRYIFSLLIPLLFLPIVYTYQRASAAAGVLIIGCFFLIGGYLRPRVVVPIMVLIVGLSVFSNIIERFWEPLKSFWEGDIRPDFFTSYADSWTSRVGAYLRGLDVILFSFPSGVGPGRVDIFMGSAVVPNYFGLSKGWMEAQHFYWIIASGQHPTGSHSFFINFIAEYGLLGVVAMWVFISGFLSNLRIFGRVGKGLKKNNLQFFLVQTTAYSVLAGIAFWWIYYHYTFYWLWFFLFFLTYFLPKYDSEITRRFAGNVINVIRS